VPRLVLLPTLAQHLQQHDEGQRQQQEVVAIS
jgi:hypothetical protein